MVCARYNKRFRGPQRLLLGGVLVCCDEPDIRACGCCLRGTNECCERGAFLDTYTNGWVRESVGQTKPRGEPWCGLPALPLLFLLASYVNAIGAREQHTDTRRTSGRGTR